MKLRSLLAAVAALFSASASAREPLSVGEAAPKLDVMTDAGATLDLAKAYQSGLTLVYFYPKADTPGCTKQACSLRDAYASLEDAGVTVFGVSMDSVEDQAAFKEKYSLPFTLIADKDGALVSAFGVPSRGQFAARQAFLIKEGNVVWRDLKASTAKQAEDVKMALAAL
ncbi:MAG: peroxiredoxin [Verrucomicrobiota bacterium]